MQTRFVTNNSHGTITIQELPQKGKKRLRVFKYSAAKPLHAWYGRDADAFLLQNILMQTYPEIYKQTFRNDDCSYLTNVIQINTEMEYEQVKETITALVEQTKQEFPAVKQGVYLSEDTVHYLEIAPPGSEANSAFQGADFTITASWNKWSCYDPGADLQNHDPSYIQYCSTSNASARKLFKMLQKNPNLLNSVTWRNFHQWLEQAKIKFDTHFSQWT